jgi:hypothetical protein
MVAGGTEGAGPSARKYRAWSDEHGRAPSNSSAADEQELTMHNWREGVLKTPKVASNARFRKGIDDSLGSWAWEWPEVATQAPLPKRSKAARRPWKMPLVVCATTAEYRSMVPSVVKDTDTVMELGQ